MISLAIKAPVTFPYSSRVYSINRVLSSSIASLWLSEGKIYFGDSNVKEKKFQEYRRNGEEKFGDIARQASLHQAATRHIQSGKVCISHPLTCFSTFPSFVLPRVPVSSSLWALPTATSHSPRFILLFTCFTLHRPSKSPSFPMVNFDYLRKDNPIQIIHKKI